MMTRVKSPDTLLLTWQDVAALLSLDECIAAVEEAFRRHGAREASAPGILGLHADAGGFHIKAGLYDGDRPYFVAKTNANFSGNPERFGLPAIQGVILVCDAEKGSPLAVLDSMEITRLRTGAATAVAAKHLSRADAGVVTVCGCGIQGGIQLRAVARVRRLRRAYAYDLREEQARRLAAELSGALGVAIEPVQDLAAAVRRSDICITCTPARRYYLSRGDVRPGMFIAAVGADSPDKQELEPELVASAKLVADVLEQCATIGELHHAIEGGLLTRADVHAELGEVVAGRKPGRTSEEEIMIFDSTGMALQDAAAAVLVYEKALRAGRGRRLNFTD